ncbi:MAG: hypothetical protein CBC13_01930 [Planctomycetia bacterium TMED53]|nr:MAG: hypothetical protein CBC13_01930 [Planctomycetia bacterium TMED53]
MTSDEPGATATGASASEVSASEALAELAQQVASCEKCSLCQSRNRTVFGTGDPKAKLMFVGEAPGSEEDRRGEPFVGPAGQLLDKIITQGLKLTRDEVYIANVLKCRPPNNRDPRPDEVGQCRAYLEEQIDWVQPQVLVALGRPAASFLTGVETSLKRLRGTKHEFRGIPVVVTYHPAFLLREPQYKSHCWQDLQAVIRTLSLSG